MSPAGPSPSRDAVAAWLCATCALADLAAGLCFFVDPSTAHTPGSPAYWASLAAAPPARQAFLAAFAVAGLSAFCALDDVARLIDGPEGVARLAVALGRLGFGVAAVTYFRLLGGEAQRAAAFASGSEPVRQSIASFSLSLDPGGYLIFGASGLSLLLFGAAAARRSPAVPRWIAALAAAAGACYAGAFAARLFGWVAGVDVAAGLGGVVIAPLWWAGLARRFLARKRQVDPAR